MGAWPWYILATVVLGLLMLLALQWIADAAHRTEPAPAPMLEPRA